jgi:hypothetical protein
MCIELKVCIILVSGSSVLSFVPVAHISIPHSHIISLVCPLFHEFSNISLHVDVIVRWSLNLKFAGCVCVLTADMCRAGIEQL